MAVAFAPHGISVASIAPGVINSGRRADKLSGAGGGAIRSRAVWASGAILDFNGAS
ncbi:MULTISPECIES: hypothetical protein [unclassified Salinibacterium]|uniref:hypothetical protein n=1 Tax=unclassified Salinibacterium TaxID=2632331 RepID=UPI00143D7143|nr:MULTISPECIES: hypothetical protein [unclassified Salinibacterium]